MSEAAFDPYHKWLGIPPAEQPADYYRLLGISLFEQDADVIDNAAQRQISHLRTFAIGPNADLSQQLLNEVAVARATLLSPVRKAEYDRSLKQSRADDQIDFDRAQSSVESVQRTTPPSITDQELIPAIVPSFAESSPAIGTVSRTQRRSKKASSWSRHLWVAAALLATVVLSAVLLKVIQQDSQVAQTPPNQTVNSSGPAISPRITKDKQSSNKQEAKRQTPMSMAKSPESTASELKPAETTGVSNAKSAMDKDAVPLVVNSPDTEQATTDQQRTTEHLGDPSELTNSIGMKLKLIPAGTFTMGDVHHEVILTKAFYLGIHEVTQSQYEQVMGNNPSRFKGADNPVERVNWNDAVEFCKRLSALPGERSAGREYRLPTEAEWEYACRAGTTMDYSFGDDRIGTRELRVDRFQLWQ